MDSLLITINDNPVNQPCQAVNIPNTFKLNSMSADDRRTLGFLLEFYVDTGDSIRYFPNPSVLFYSGNIAVSKITAAGQATIRAIGSVIQKVQLFSYAGVLYTVQVTVAIGDANFNVLPRY